MENTNSSLCNLAKLAKQRLKENCYKQHKILLTKSSTLNTTEESKRQRSNITTINNKDEFLYQRVCAILSHGKSLNPIGQLIDHNFFRTLSVEAKQRYIVSLTEKFYILKQRYYKEHFYNYAFV